MVILPKMEEKKLSIHEGISNFPPNKVKIWLQKSNWEWAGRRPGGGGGGGKRNSNYFEMTWNFIEILVAKFHKVSINFTKFHKVSQNHISCCMVVNVDIEFLELNLCLYIM